MPMLAKVEVFIVDAIGWHTSRSECSLEILYHPTWATHVYLSLCKWSTTTRRDLLHREKPFTLRVGEVRPECWIVCGCRADFVEKQGLVFGTHRVVEVDVELQRLLWGKRTYPTPKWRDPDATSNPHLLVTTASVVEHPEGHAHTCWNTWVQGVDQPLRLIP